ncbi:hypothetical protein [Streptomyces albus]|uniref:hypothetical protein n=1 Tax=Streptomyces TaxID=1883 RepID=UPI001F09F3F5|nr:hypothetical protein [Streptomyces albus]
MPSPSEARIHLDLAPTRTDAVTATLTGNGTVLAHGVLTSYGFRETGPDTLILARIDHEEPYYAAQAAKVLEYAGLPVTVTPALQEEIDTEWDWAFHPMPWCTRAEVREVLAEAQEIFDDIGSGRLVIHQHAEDGWTTVAVGTYLNGKSVHLHGEDHLRTIETTYDTPAEALEDFKRRHDDAVRPGPAPATTTEETARLVRAGIHPAKAQRPHDPQPETFRTAGPGDHEALLGRFLDDHRDRDRYRPSPDDATYAVLESQAGVRSSSTTLIHARPPGPSPSTPHPSVNASGTPLPPPPHRPSSWTRC